MTLQHTRAARFWLALALLAVALASPAAADSDNESYGYLRVVDGSATLMQGGSGDRDAAEVNQPVLAGDRLWVPNRSRVEIVLADGNVLRLDGDTEITLEQLAASPDSDARGTVLRLHQGNLLLTVTSDSLGDELPRVDTANAAVYVQHYGTYRISSNGDWTEVVVRRGTAEVVTDRDREEVRADESAWIEGGRDARVEVNDADTTDGLERWARKLEDDVQSADVRYVDDNLRYRSAPLARHGSWVTIENRPYWRPHVNAGWRPYSHGRWAYTPSGLTWVSYESWGWVPYHYGSWDHVPTYGWVWQPGRVFAPAWVYWYWGPNHVGWCPTGYYTRYYGNRYGHHGFRRGVYGWAGGDWGGYNHWTFVPKGNFGHRGDLRRYAVPTDRLRSLGPEVPRGIITTDTRGLRPNDSYDPREAVRVLTRARGARPDEGGELPDVTTFIERRRDLSPGVASRVAVDRVDPQLEGTPLRPDTLGPSAGRRPAGNTRPDSDMIARPVGPRPNPGNAGSNAGARPDASAGVDTDARRATRSRPADTPPAATRPAPGAPGGAPRPDVDRGRPDAAPRSRNDDGDANRATRAVRPGGAPRPEARDNSGRSDSDRSDRGEDGRSGAARVRPQYEVLTTPPDSGSRSTRSTRPEAGKPGGAPRPDRDNSAPSPYDRSTTRSGGADRPTVNRGYEPRTPQVRQPSPSSPSYDSSARDRRSGSAQTPSYTTPRPSPRPSTPPSTGSSTRPERGPERRESARPAPEPRTSRDGNTRSGGSGSRSSSSSEGNREGNRGSRSRSRDDDGGR